MSKRQTSIRSSLNWVLHPRNIKMDRVNTSLQFNKDEQRWISYRGITKNMKLFGEASRHLTLGITGIHWATTGQPGRSGQAEAASTACSPSDSEGSEGSKLSRDYWDYNDFKIF